MFVGNHVEINKFQFVLIDADEYAYNYMERHSDEVKGITFIKADFILIKNTFFICNEVQLRNCL
jgi:hypothetical protein